MRPGEILATSDGFVVDGGRGWARPVGIALGADGALFVGADGHGTIWRVTYPARR